MEEIEHVSNDKFGRMFLRCNNHDVGTLKLNILVAFLRIIMLLLFLVPRRPEY